MFNFVKKLFKKPAAANGQLGGLVSPHDDRDHIKVFVRDINTQQVAGASDAPESFTLEKRMGKILNQGTTNSCTGHAATYFMNILLSKTLGSNKDYSINPYFNYYYARKESGLLDQDGGAYIRSTLNALRRYGIWCCNMTTPFQQVPSDYCKEQSFKLKAYESISQYSNTLIDDLKYVLSIEQLPLMLCVNIIERNIDSYYGTMKGDTMGVSSGWHAMCAIGYETRSDGVYFKVANSWSSRWGDNGFAWIHEDYFKTKSLISEIWCPTKEYY
jgi:C1A family cysteine protease